VEAVSPCHPLTLRHLSAGIEQRQERSRILLASKLPNPLHHHSQKHSSLTHRHSTCSLYSLANAAPAALIRAQGLEEEEFNDILRLEEELINDILRL
jgi:hypothetical protein